MSDVVTQAALRKMADEYIAQAEEIESKENNAAIDDGTSASAGGFNQMFRCFDFFIIR
jgi:hypothetical protein